MRKLTDHIVLGDSANHQLEIEVQDEAGSGGACHKYAIYGYYTKSNPSADSTCDGETKTLILFQNGPIKEAGVNGITHEALTAILLDRLRSFQEGPYRSRENAVALTHFEEGLMWLQKRTRERMARGVEGTTQK
jgi:hypothetical protein